MTRIYITSVISVIVTHSLLLINLLPLSNCLLTAFTVKYFADKKSKGHIHTMPRLMCEQPSNLYGPLEIQWAEGKGRGLFLTEDVEEDQVLLREEVFEYGFSTPSYKSIDVLVLKLYNRVIIDEDFNAVLATLTDGTSRGMSKLPKLKQLAVDTNHSITFCPTLTIENIQGIVRLNSFNYYDNNPFTRLSSTSNSESCNDNGDEVEVEGSALWLITSFMNHDSKEPNTYRRQDGKFNTLTAARKLQRGTELTTRYHHSAKALQQWGIFESF